MSTVFELIDFRWRSFSRSGCWPRDNV